METYEVIFKTDEEVLKSLPRTKQKSDILKEGWIQQQLVKLMFHKLSLCNFYIILDSDLYFIKNFYISDFMFNNKTPYTSMTEEKKEEYLIIQNYLQRKGKPYCFVRLGQVFSKMLLENMEKNLLQSANKSWCDLLEISPFEMQWYGEYYIKTRPYELYPCSNLFKYFWLDNQYRNAQKEGKTEQDFIIDGNIGILMQNSWVKDKTYKPSIFYIKKRKLLKLLNTFIRKSRHFIRKNLKTNHLGL